MMMIELITAIAIFAITMSAVALLRAADAAAPDDIRREGEALRAAEYALEGARARASIDFSDATSTAAQAGDLSTALDILDISPCLKQAVAKSSYRGRTDALKNAALATSFASLGEMERLGDDCAASPPPPASLSHAAVLWTGTTTAFDVLDGTAYIGTDAPPYLSIVRIADDGESHAYGPFANGFSLPAKPNAVDAVSVEGPDGAAHRYLYAALATSSEQFAVADVTNLEAPALSATRSLASVGGDEPAAWRVLYYGGVAYVTTRRTAGPELHLFDVSDPADPQEEGGGTEINSTINSLAARDQGTGAGLRRYLFIAAERAGGELAVYDVTDPQHSGGASELLGSRADLPGMEDALSLTLNGNRLYLGREASSSGPELFAFDAGDPADGLPLIGSAETASAVSGMRAWGTYLFLAARHGGGDIEMWDVASASAMTPVNRLSFPGALDIDLGGEQLYGLSGGSLAAFPLVAP